MIGWASVKLRRSIRLRQYKIAHRAHFDAADSCRRNTRGQLKRLVEIVRIDQVEARQLFLGLGKRSIGGRHLAVAYAHGGRGVHRMQRFGRDDLPGLAQGFAEGMTLAVGDVAQRAFFHVNEAKVFHLVVLLDRSNIPSSNAPAQSLPRIWSGAGTQFPAIISPPPTRRSDWRSHRSLRPRRRMRRRRRNSPPAPVWENAAI